ncbi:MAG: rhodanese-like domain-containing protein [Bacillaceae bacterium]|nr:MULTISPECIES: rhodanese-like domain-containing protein [Bacillaceae]MDX5476170.1 rhodanese-like domain-containing protein [Bacillaceae bacterium]KGA97925.1 sulfurtransferase [Alkalihalobacillus alcalophilus ATCC 27647 = CGMCC 1.3604]KHF38247.1 sulfurtransferase [Halalkalibacter okhensis]MED1562701.1 rhodanese-like domain-containing protein [Alkalihalobacillus alcalophilus]THG92325.1 sulfurtransferase [Alkalihalobacillus alcalophilus ATCC 27647 = CGMCC 1.3604]
MRKYLLPLSFIVVIVISIVIVVNPFQTATLEEDPISQKWDDINQEEVLMEVGNEYVEVVDLREVELYKEGHISGAINIPYEEFQDRYNELNQEKRIILICHTGRMGVESADFLVEKGFDKVANFGGGMAVWDGPLSTE